MIIPSIDLMDGKAVKLVKGNPNNKKYETDALELAERFSIYPEINLIDLDAAFGKGNNINLIKKICKICSCNVGGGIRSIEKAYEILKMGANKIIIGTKADKGFLTRLPKEKVIVAIDSKKGTVVNKGWKNITDVTPIEKVIELQDYCSGFLYTFVDKEGTMQDIDYETILQIRESTDKKIYYAGGISKKEQIVELAKYDINTVIGMAYYKRNISLNETFVGTMDFKKSNGLIPTIVKNKSGQVLMLAFSTKKSVLRSLNERKGIYFSRKRQKLWKKGETSGNTQKLVRVKADCDRDTLIYTVEQKKYACHTGQYSCFSDKEFDFGELLEIIKSRKGSSSYSGRLLADEKEIKNKIMEEAKEVVNYLDMDNLKWEIADLLYFVSVLMVKNNLNFEDIKKELEIRNYIKSGKLGNIK